LNKIFNSLVVQNNARQALVVKSVWPLPEFYTPVLSILPSTLFSINERPSLKPIQSAKLECESKQHENVKAASLQTVRRGLVQLNCDGQEVMLARMISEFWFIWGAAAAAAKVLAGGTQLTYCLLRFYLRKTENRPT
jgi:hypothetical protein